MLFILVICLSSPFHVDNLYFVECYIISEKCLELQNFNHPLYDVILDSNTCLDILLSMYLCVSFNIFVFIDFLNSIYLCLNTYPTKSIPLLSIGNT
jgi:hypothetical protein